MKVSASFNHKSLLDKETPGSPKGTFHTDPQQSNRQTAEATVAIPPLRDIHSAVGGLPE